MSTYTTNYNLEKPDASDPFGDFRQSYNGNMDIIDQNLGGGGGSSTLAGLSDVDLNNVTDGQVLTYDNVSQKWVNANSGGGGGGGSIQITSTVLYEPTTATSVNVDYTLLDSIDNYDFISIINGVWSEYYGSGDKFAEDSFVPVDTFNRLYTDSKQYAITSYSTRFLHLNLHGSTLRVTAKSNLDVCKIIGHKMSGGGGSSTEYSLTEKIIGKWIDNSTLYERVIEYSCQNNATIQVADAMSNGEQLKNVISPIFIASNGDMIADRWVGMDFWQWVYDHTSGIMVQRKTSDGNWQSGVTFRAVIQYTKTSP